MKFKATSLKSACQLKGESSEVRVHVFILGSGGREAAIYRKLRSSDQVQNLFFFPGNAMTGAGNAQKQPNSASFEDLEKFFQANQVECLVIGPEQPLVDGIVDYFAEKMPGLLVCGPKKEAAQLEGSKIFSAQIMEELNIPYAASREIYDQNGLDQALHDLGLPIVLKADGLAAGKGVTIHSDKESAIETGSKLLSGQLLGESGEKILAQQFLKGQEASLFALCNGKEAIYLPTARDYKRAYDKDEGPNTGGMGSYCPGGHLSPDHIAFAHERIVLPVIQKFNYTGFLYVGLMIHSAKADDLSVIEFNVRLGDPETQSILPMLEEDLLPYLIWAAGGASTPITVQEPAGYRTIPQKVGACVNVVLAAKGYPGAYDKGHQLDIQPPQAESDLHLIHAGTRYQDQQLLSAGGRVMNVVALGESVSAARDKIYKYLATQGESLDANFFFRQDIAE